MIRKGNIRSYTKIFVQKNWIFLFSILIFLIPTSIAFAQTQELISVATSEPTYNEGDTIVISGQVSSVILDTPVSIQIFHSGNLVEIAQLTVAQDGKFTHTIIASGPLWKGDGTYTVRASYGTKVVETNFEFFSKQTESPTQDTFEVDAGTSGSFDVPYTIRGGTVENMIIDPDILGMIVIIDSEIDGTLTLDLPRNFIDSKKSDGTDDAFLVFIDGAEVRPEETSSDSKSRVLTINFEEGDSDIEIIGTFVVPEFASIALFVFVTSIILVPIITIKNKTIFYWHNTL